MSHKAERIEISVWRARQSPSENGLPKVTYDYCINVEYL